MENEEYYVGYLRNPKDIITSGFQDIKELEVVVVFENNVYREAITRGKIYVGIPIFDGHRVFQSDSKFVGRIGEKIPKEVAYQKLQEYRDMKEEYANKLKTLMNDTFDLALLGEKSYIDTVERFVRTFRK